MQLCTPFEETAKPLSSQTADSETFSITPASNFLLGAVTPAALILVIA